MRKILALFVIAFTSVITSVCGQFTNVIVDNNFGPQEPSITINAVNVSQMVAGSNTNNSYYSVDGGATWITTFINSSLGSTGDPCLVSDSLGNIFYFHLSDMYDRIVCQKSINGGLNYNDGFFTWNNNSQLQDKEWATVDRHSNNIYVTWTQYDGGFNPGPQDSSRIYFAKSEDNGTTFSDGKAFLTSPDTGEVFVVDAKTNTIVDTIKVGEGPRFISSGGGSVWVLNQDDGKVVRIDSVTKKVTASIDAKLSGGGGDITYGEGAVWVTMPGIPVVKINAETNTVMKQYKGYGMGDAIRVAYGSIWVSGSKLHRIDKPVK